MTQYERMVKGLVYDTCDPEIQAMQGPYQDRLWEFKQLRPSDGAAKEAYMKEVFAECGDYCSRSDEKIDWEAKSKHPKFQ